MIQHYDQKTTEWRQLFRKIHRLLKFYHSVFLPWGKILGNGSSDYMSIISMKYNAKRKREG